MASRRSASLPAAATTTTLTHLTTPQLPTRPPASEPVTLRLGYFPNVTHAPAVVGVEHGEFEEALGENVTLEPSIFNAGPAAVEAIFAGALDASFIGPNPSINAYAQSNGRSVRVVSGTASGGAYLVVKPET